MAVSGQLCAVITLPMMKEHAVPIEYEAGSGFMLA